MNVPRKPRPRKEKEPADGGTALALIGLLAVTGGLLLLGTLVLGGFIFGLLNVAFGFFCFGAIHYLLWGWWLKSTPPDEDEEETLE